MKPTAIACILASIALTLPCTVALKQQNPVTPLFSTNASAAAAKEAKEAAAAAKKEAAAQEGEQVMWQMTGMRKGASRKEQLEELIDDVGDEFEHVNSSAFKNLRAAKAGCNKIQSEEVCVKSRDGRSRKKFHFTNETGSFDIRYDVSPCQWCCGDDCNDGGSKCEAREWLMTAGKENYHGYGKNGLGQDNCDKHAVEKARREQEETQEKLRQALEKDRIFREYQKMQKEEHPVGR